MIHTVTKFSVHPHAASGIQSPRRRRDSLALNSPGSSRFVVTMDDNGAGTQGKPKRRRIATSPQPLPGPSRANAETSSVPACVNNWQNLDGMILSVHLKNFMCHQEFHYEPTNCLNFLRYVYL